MCLIGLLAMVSGIVGCGRQEKPLQPSTVVSESRPVDQALLADGFAPGWHAVPGSYIYAAAEDELWKIYDGAAPGVVNQGGREAVAQAYENREGGADRSFRLFILRFVDKACALAYLEKEVEGAKGSEKLDGVDAGDIFNKRSLLAAVANDAMTDTTPLRNIIASFVDEAMIKRIAEEYAKGRLLLIMTTNLDQGRSVIWNIGAIAASEYPGKRDLIIDILRASAAIPGLFPPVMLDVSIDGKRYQEMHVDGGAVAQAFLYPPTLNLKTNSALYGIQRKRVAYILRNGRLFRPEENVKRQTLSIATQAISTMTATSGVNDTYRMYVTTKRDGVSFNLAYIDSDFTVPYKGPFDQGYMRALFEYGYNKGKAGYHWHKTPPGYQE